MDETGPAPKRSLWKRLFFSPREPRLRAGWRLAIQTMFVLVMLICAAIPISWLTVIFHLRINSATYLTFSTLVELVGFTTSVYLARRFLDRRSFTSLGLKLGRQVFPDLLAGITISFVMMGLIYLAMGVLGWIHFEGLAWPFRPLSIILGQTLLFLLIFTFVGWQEELLSRGYHLQTLASGTNLF